MNKINNLLLGPFNFASVAGKNSEPSVTNAVKNAFDAKPRVPSEKLINATANLIVRNPKGVLSLLQKSGVAIDSKATVLQLKDALVKKLATDDVEFYKQFAVLLQPEVAKLKSKYSNNAGEQGGNLFGLGDVTGFGEIASSAADIFGTFTSFLFGGFNQTTPADAQLSSAIVSAEIAHQQTLQQQSKTGTYVMIGILLVGGVVIVAAIR